MSTSCRSRGVSFHASSWRAFIIFPLLCKMILAAGLLETKRVSAETLVEFNNDSRTVVALRVGTPALQKWLPPMWEIDPAAAGLLNSANLLLVFINPWLTQDPEGKPTSVPIDRRLLLVIPAKNKRTGESTILVAHSYDANPKDLPGPYKNSVSATMHLEQTLEERYRAGRGHRVVASGHRPGDDRVAPAVSTRSGDAVEPRNQAALRS
jgi:hypothetical protein